jgi:maltoporin
MSKLFKSLFCLAVAAFVAMPAVSASADDSFEYHGYMRSGFSFNENLNRPQGSMQCNGASTKYRLGNETNDTYIENQFTKVWTAENGVSAKLVTMLDWHQQETNTYGEATNGMSPRIRQTYVDINTGDMSFWVGQRYYSREDIYIIDFYYRDLTAWGAGMEGLSVGVGNLSVAWLTGANGDTIVDPAVQMNDGSDNIGYSMLHGADVQLNDIELGFASLNVDVMYQKLTGDDDVTDAQGVFGEVSLNMPTFLGMSGFLKVVGQVGVNACAVNLGNFSQPMWSTSDADRKSNLEKQKAYRGIIWGAAQITPEFSLSPVVLCHVKDNDGTKTRWISSGVRAKYALSQTFAMQLEVGNDNVKDDAAGTTTNLTKITVAPTVQIASGFWSRPELRVYATYGFWNDDTTPGAAESADDKNAFQFGFQAEAWW